MIGRLVSFVLDGSRRSKMTSIERSAQEDDKSSAPNFPVPSGRAGLETDIQISVVYPNFV